MRYILILISFSLFFSCSSNHEIDIKKDKTATFSFNVKNKDSLINTIKEWGYIDSAQGNIVDTNELKDELEKNEYIDDVLVISDKNSNYSGNFSVSDINKVFNDNIFTLTQNEGNSTLKISLSIDNYKYIKETIPTLKQESIDMLGPDANQDLSKEEYLDMISFSLGDDGPRDLELSTVNLRINVDGDITEYSGGDLINSRSINFKIPLLDLILLKQKIEYIIVYK